MTWVKTGRMVHEYRSPQGDILGTVRVPLLRRACLLARVGDVGTFIDGRDWKRAHEWVEARVEGEK